jgi:SAM-dependent methyltransferase
LQPGKKLIDLGCGNGRDSKFFCHNGLKVTAIDSSKKAIDSFEESLPIFAVCNDFVKTKALSCLDFDYCYARWSVHAINLAQQNVLLPNLYRSLKNGGLFLSESRSINDKKYKQGKPLGMYEFFCDGHYRRFLDPVAFLEQLESVGFEIIFFEESDRFSVMGEDSPTLIRTVAKKQKG